MASESRFWDRIAAKYAKNPIADMASYERKLETTRRYLTPDSEVLELGCGTGSTAIEHAPRVRHIDAVDLSPKMIEIARAKTETAGVDNITFHVASLDAYDAPPERYDVALCLSVLHLVDDRDAALARVFQWLKPGGLLFASTACLGDDMAFMRFILPIGRAFGLLPLVRVFKSDALIASMESAGFEVVERWCPGKRKATFVVARRASASSR